MPMVTIAGPSCVDSTTRWGGQPCVRLCREATLLSGHARRAGPQPGDAHVAEVTARAGRDKVSGSHPGSGRLEPSQMRQVPRSPMLTHGVTARHPRAHSTRHQQRMHHLPRQLSGGQEQRVTIARAIVSDPTFLLCDEPTGDLDRKSADDVMAIIEELVSKYHKTVLIIVTTPSSPLGLAPFCISKGAGRRHALQAPRPRSGRTGDDLCHLEDRGLSHRLPVCPDPILFPRL